MSSSCNLTGAAARILAVEEFVYQQILGSDAAVPASPASSSSLFGTKAGPAAADRSQPSESETARREKEAYERGLKAGREEMRMTGEQSASDSRKYLTESLKKFAQERDQYYRSLEGEIVDLALAVARKVLHREAQVDRVVLAGVVRVALEKIAGDGQVRMHVNPRSAAAWKQHVSAQTDLAVVPEIVSDESLHPDQLVLKAAHGSTELGIEAQLKEIEKGFTDLVEQKRRTLRQ